MDSPGSVTLVGGGPGDPGLITVRGLEALRAADAVVYDYLAPEALLTHCGPGAERICVGKRAGRHTMPQQEINALLIRLAQEGRRVVRLKGGDPFVFGRGGEEAEALADAGVPFRVVPGVTSAIAAPAYAGIPVTHRGLTSSFAVVTGHEDPGKPQPSLDWEALARVDTLVILMGIGNLAQIVDALLCAGRASTTPVAVVQWGTMGQQRTVRATLTEIVRCVREAAITAPAVIVVGEVVALRDKLTWYERLPLHGLRILVPRTRDQEATLSLALRALGAEPVSCPLIEVVDPRDWGPLDAAIGRLTAYDWVLFTSANAVQRTFERLHVAGLDARAMAGRRIGALGAATAAALGAVGLRPDAMPLEYRAEALAEVLGDVCGQRVLLPVSALARDELPQRLREAGAKVDRVVAYRTMAPEGLSERLPGLLANVDVVTFTSSSTVEHLLAALDPAQSREMLAHRIIACIGPVTAETARAHGLLPAIVAEEHTIPGLVTALSRWRVGQRVQKEVTA